MTELDFIKFVVKDLERFYIALGRSKSIEQPKWVHANSQFRHQTKSDCLLIYLKGARWISLLNASIVLLEAGQVHEMGILCRCMDETLEDMFLFVRNLGPDGTPTADQERALADFFQEQFEDPTNPLGSAIKRNNRVIRRKVRAAIAGLPENSVNRHDHIQIHETIDGAYSGYVHGAYPHIMELYGGNPTRFHMSGMLGTPRMTEWQRQLVVHVDRAVLAAWYAAKRLGEEDLAGQVFLVREVMEKRYPEFTGDPNDHLRELKGKQRNSK